jgi:adenylate cyclase, class 2
MREIEVKARLKSTALFLEKATQKGIEFGAPIIQDDTTYETTIPYDDPAWNIFRIRRQDNKTILTMKYKASDRSRDNHERETTVGNAGQIADMLLRLGYSKGVHIRKSRQTAKINQIELCLDTLDNLGTFVEAEMLVADDADVDSIQNELWKLLLDLGVDPSDRIHKGYDTLMHEYLQNKK